MVVMLLSACANLHVAQDQTQFTDQSPKVRMVNLSAIQNWSISGAMSVTQRGKGHIFSFNWIEKGDSYTIKLSATLNLASLVILGQPGKVTLVKGDYMYHAATPEALLATQADTQLPISDLKYWVRSIPAPNQRYLAQYDRYGHLIDLQQDGWHVTFSNFLTVGQVDVPQKIMMTSPDLTVRIVVKQWLIQ